MSSRIEETIMKNLFLAVFALSSFFSIFSTRAEVWASEQECLEGYPDISFNCRFQAKTYPEVIYGSGKHISLRAAKLIAKEQCETVSGIKCAFDSCHEAFGLYSKTYNPNGSQTITLGGSSPAARAYKMIRLKDKEKLKKLRQEAERACSNL